MYNARLAFLSSKHCVIEKINYQYQSNKMLFSSGERSILLTSDLHSLSTVDPMSHSSILSTMNPDTSILQGEALQTSLHVSAGIDRVKNLSTKPFHELQQLYCQQQIPVQTNSSVPKTYSEAIGQTRLDHSIHGPTEQPSITQFSFTNQQTSTIPSQTEDFRASFSEEQSSLNMCSNSSNLLSGPVR